MQKGFWDALPRLFFVLAPLADVTDAAFRRVIAKYGKPDAMWTEFVSADGLAFAPEAGRKKLLADLAYSEAERPIVAQFFSGNPESMEKAAALAASLGFDGVDINMGCPDKSVEKQHAGAALMREPRRAKEIVAAAVRGASGAIPVSVKTRLGYNRDELDAWLPALLETDAAAVIIHARTRKEMSAVPAHWERIAEAVRMRNRLNPNVLIVGNGDARDVADARAKAEETGADGVMLGRAIFGNPWLFAPMWDLRGPTSSSHVGPRRSHISVGEQLQVLVEHTKLFEELFLHPSSGLGAGKNFAIMKKHYKAYVKDFPGAAELRAELMDAPNAAAVETIVNNILAKSPPVV